MKLSCSHEKNTTRLSPASLTATDRKLDRGLECAVECSLLLLTVFRIYIVKDTQGPANGVCLFYLQVAGEKGETHD